MTMLRVLYDAAGFDSQKFGGVTHYFINLFREMQCEISPVLSVVQTENTMLNDYFRNIPLVPAIGKDEFMRRWPGFVRRKVYRFLRRQMPARLRIPEAINAKALSNTVNDAQYDMVHLTGCHFYGKSLAINFNRPVVITIHDLIPDLANCKEIIAERKQVLSIASHVIAVSENTKNDLVRLYNYPESKVTVIHHGYTAGSDVVKPVSGIGRFLLYVGGRMGCPWGDGSMTGYKNFRFMLEALAPYIRENPGLSLFCTGSAFSKEELALIDKLSLSRQVRQAFVDDAELAWLYENAEAFIYPSLYEGFGMPIVDAFARGCPVVCCRASCFPEVAGDAALYFDPGDGDGLIGCLESLRNPSVRDEMVQRGRARANRFSWQEAARKTLDVYRMVCEG